MRVVRIAPARQLALFAGEDGFPGRWDGLPEQVQALLAQMIARSVLGPGAAGSSREVPS